ncbi:hypothetical protein [Oerskovia flava]|uniref:hypothetical protein n=1 Tax=Oerskovia flava TaxID=2986422 RepID=UPI00223F58CB|nr:hypothetical protein [Oerskovia sp. JB1-3-2]
MSDRPAHPPIVPWSWGTGPQTREIPLPVVMRAIRTGDFTDFDRAEQYRPVEVVRPPVSSWSLILPRAALARLSGVAAGVVGGAALVVLLVLVGGA